MKLGAWERGGGGVLRFCRPIPGSLTSVAFQGSFRVHRSPPAADDDDDDDDDEKDDGTCQGYDIPFQGLLV